MTKQRDAGYSALKRQLKGNILKFKDKFEKFLSFHCDLSIELLK